MTTITVALRDSLFSLDLILTSRYRVPTTAHQCIPETAPASTTAEMVRFRHDVTHMARKIKKIAKAIVLVIIEMVAAPAMYAGR